MSPAAPDPQLRLVGTDDPAAMATWDDRRRAAGVARETRAAAANPDLDPADPRWVLAARTVAQLQGAQLPPERRERLMRTADSLGVRPFDANVIIAIMQDRARTGRDPRSAASLLALLPEPGRAAPGRGPAPVLSAPVRLWLGALIAAAVGVGLLAWWVTGGG